jgi:hypothetical protein
MHVIGHQDIGMNTAIEFTSAFLQIIVITPKILPSIETGLAVITALDDVLWNTNKIEARFAWHICPEQAKRVREMLNEPEGF